MKFKILPPLTQGCEGCSQIKYFIVSSLQTELDSSMILQTWLAWSYYKLTFIDRGTYQLQRRYILFPP